ncbi:MAG: hypothetical protein Tsb0015_14190 [Simkaniaceae bacterium]
MSSEQKKNITQNFQKSFFLRPWLLVVFFLGFFTFGVADEEEILKSMTLEEKIGQLFIVPACAERYDDRHFFDLEQLIKKYHVGGILLKTGTPLQQRNLIHLANSCSKLPMIIAADAENGLAMRMSKTIAFPKNLTLGAVKDDSLLYEMGKEIGRQCRLLGIHMNFAPVIDVNTNPNNPIIHMRSFGDCPEKVAAKGAALVRGMQENHVIACAKHFPGHGDVSIDSHLGLPTLLHQKKRLEEIEIRPFREMMQAGLDAIMTAHLQVPSMDTEYPATLSHRLIHNYWKEKMHYAGLMVTDALNMKALTMHFTSQEIALQALLAGNDLLLYGDHISDKVDEILQKTVPLAADFLILSCRQGKISEDLINEKVRKILQRKKAFEENKHTDELLAKLNTPEAFSLRKELYRQALTLVEDPHGILQQFSGENIAYVERGINQPSLFYKEISNKFPVSYFNTEDADLRNLLKELAAFDRVIIGDFGCSCAVGSQCNITDDWRRFLMQLNEKAVHVIFKTPYSLMFLPCGRATVMGYEPDPDMQEAAAQLISGQIKANGELPITVQRL